MEVHRESTGPAVEALIEKVAAADGESPLSEHKAIEVAAGDTGGLSLWDDGEMVGYAHLSHHQAHCAVELVIAESHRTDEVVDLLLRVAGRHEPLQVWAWSPWLVASLERLGWRSIRRLHQLRRPLPPDRRPVLPPEVDVRHFRVGVDDEEWLALNRAAFADHPEQGVWDRRQLEERMQLDWFDPSGFHLAWEAGRMVAFCWTKVHMAESLGEIYVIGVHPEARGRSLGTEMTLVGLWHLHEADRVGTGMLYVDDVNPWALTMYERLGFEPAEVSQAFAQPNR